MSTPTTAILTLTNLDIKKKVLTVGIVLTVQGVSSNIKMTILEKDLTDVALNSSPSRTDWNNADVCAYCSTTIGLNVTLPV